ncbi:peptidase, partial [gut metagenome]
MSLSLNIDNYGGKSVVPITCNHQQGTGFYIGNNCFLTAYHVVSDAEYDSAVITTCIDGIDYSFELVKLGEWDVALLKCQQSIDDMLIPTIPLLNTPFKDKQDLQIIGFPQEIGNGVDYFGVSVRNARELSNHERGFDVVVHRTDSFGFYSYSGFSGSPVLNEFGYAVGVVTDQLHNSLGYTSIRSIATSLKEAGVVLQENADELDTRPYGLGTCIRMAEKALIKMQFRYREK